MFYDPHAVISTPADFLTHSPVDICSLATLPQVGNLTEVLIPYVNYRMRVRAEERSKIEGVRTKVRRTQAETGLHLEQYDRELRLLRHSRNKTRALPPGFSLSLLHP